VNQAVLPDFLSVYSDPTLQKIHGTELLGYYPFDDEGVKGRRVMVVENGVLKNPGGIRHAREMVVLQIRQLAGLPPLLELPTDRPRPAVQSYKGAAHRFTLDRELTRALGTLARAEGATLFMVLLAAFQVVLSRWSGQSDVVVGTPIAGRTHREVEGLIGFFANMLAMRVRVDPNASFREMLDQVRELAGRIAIVHLADGHPPAGCDRSPFLPVKHRGFGCRPISPRFF